MSNEPDYKDNLFFESTQITVPDVGNVQVLDHSWYSVPNYGFRFGEECSDLLIGIVKYKNDFGEEKIKIGVTKTKNIRENIIEIIQTGVPFHG